MRRIAEKLGNEMKAKIFLIELDKQKKIIPLLKSILSTEEIISSLQKNNLKNNFYSTSFSASPRSATILKMEVNPAISKISLMNSFIEQRMILPPTLFSFLAARRRVLKPALLM